MSKASISRERVTRIDESTRVARERGDVARHVDQARRAGADDAVQRLARHAGARRIDDHGAPGARLHDRRRIVQRTPRRTDGRRAPHARGLRRSRSGRPPTRGRLRRPSRARRESPRPRRQTIRRRRKDRSRRCAGTWSDDMRHERSEQKPVALEERQHVPAKRERRVSPMVSVSVTCARSRASPAETTPVNPSVAASCSTLSANQSGRMPSRWTARSDASMFSASSMSRPSRCPASEPRHQAVERVARRRQQLPRLPHVADLVRALAKEPDPVAAHVQPRAHAIAVFRRPATARLAVAAPAADAP